MGEINSREGIEVKIKKNIRTTDILPLKICTVFFQYLNQKNIVYCHWKSNLHLKESLAGRTDLDILVSKKHREDFSIALHSFGFKQIFSSPIKCFPGMEDYLGFDSTTGEMVHLHVHYKLILGQRFIKNHHLPIESLILSNLKILDGVYVPVAEVELLLLVIRANMKFSFRVMVKNFLTRKNLSYPDDIIQEFLWLISDCNYNDLKRILNESALPINCKRLESFLEKMKNQNISMLDMVAMRFDMLKNLKKYQREPQLTVIIKSMFLRFTSLPLVRNFFNGHNKKWFQGKGKSFALIGADGSGKSTLSKDLTNWLSWKLKVHYVYFGIPKTLELKIISRIVAVMARTPLSNLKNKINKKRWIKIAKKRFSIYKKSESERSKKYIIVADRYPTFLFENMSEPMDGPRIRKVQSNGNCEQAIIEEFYYKEIEPSTAFFVLQAGFEQIRQRKSDLAEEIHKEKIDAVNAIKPTKLIKCIDVSKPYDEVVLGLKRKIWDML